VTGDDAGMLPATPPRRHWADRGYPLPRVRYVCPANLAPGICGQPLPCEIHDIPDPECGHIMWGNTYVHVMPGNAWIHLIRDADPT
jgi:hypothetical protein